MISNKVSLGKKDFKYFIGYKYDNKAKPLWIKLPKMSGYAKYFDETKHINFLIKYRELKSIKSIK